jgi:hypothetical protein
VAEHEPRLGPGRCRDGGEVLILPLGRERQRVAAVPSAATVVGDDGEAPPKIRGRGKRVAGAESADTDDKRRPVTGAVIGEDGTVG